MREVEGRVVKVPIPQGNPVLFSMLAPEGTAAGLSGILSDEKRALTVKVDEVAGVAGFIHPGDHVDVLVDLPLQEAKDHFSKTILNDILVLTTGQIWQQKGENKPVVVNTVTLELTPEDVSDEKWKIYRCSYNRWRYIDLPKDDAIRKGNKRAMEGLKVLKSSESLFW